MSCWDISAGRSAPLVRSQLASAPQHSRCHPPFSTRFSPRLYPHFCGPAAIRPMLLMGRKLPAAACLRDARPRLGMGRQGPGVSMQAMRTGARGPILAYACYACCAFGSPHPHRHSDLWNHVRHYGRMLQSAQFVRRPVVGCSSSCNRFSCSGRLHALCLLLLATISTVVRLLGLQRSIFSCSFAAGLYGERRVI
jgi:hypothetical protein